MDKDVFSINYNQYEEMTDEKLIENKNISDVMMWSVIKKLTLKVSKNFSICKSSNSKDFSGTWNNTELEIAPKLQNITISGNSKGVTLNSIEAPLFNGIKNLNNIEFKNVIIDDKSIKLETLKNSLCGRSGVKITINNKSLDNLEEKEQKKKKKKKKKQEEDGKKYKDD